MKNSSFVEQKAYSNFSKDKSIYSGVSKTKHPNAARGSVRISVDHALQENRADRTDVNKTLLTAKNILKNPDRYIEDAVAKMQKNGTKASDVIVSEMSYDDGTGEITVYAFDKSKMSQKQVHDILNDGYSKGSSPIEITIPVRK